MQKLEERPKPKSKFCANFKHVETKCNESFNCVVNILKVKGILLENASLTFEAFSKVKQKIKEPWLCCSLGTSNTHLLVLKRRTHDFYFFNKEQLLYFLIALYHLNNQLNKVFDMCKPGLIRMKFIRSKLEMIAKEEGLALHSFFIVRLL